MTMDFSVIRFEGNSSIGVPYTGWIINFNMGLEISIRQYPKNTFLAYEDSRGDMSTGVDMEDTWLPDPVLFSMTPNYLFNRQKQLQKILRKLKVSKAATLSKEIDKECAYTY